MAHPFDNDKFNAKLDKVLKSKDVPPQKAA